MLALRLPRPSLPMHAAAAGEAGLR
jgi:hypothetical protein